MRRISLLVVFIVSCHLTVNSQQASQQQGSSETPHAALTANDVSDLQKKAESGDASAAFALGNAYENGNGARKNMKLAVTWYQKAAEKGDRKAENSLGVLYWFGEGVDRDRKQAVEWYKKAARHGYANAMFNLGAAYYNGDGVPSNDTASFAWFLLAAEAGSDSGKQAAQRATEEHSPRGIADAYVAIAEMYDKGVDLPADSQRAATWYRKAAEKGHGEAQLTLAARAMKESHYDEALKWFELASKNGRSGGTYGLGYLYEHGMGVKENSNAAIKYYRDATLGGNRAALHALTEMHIAGKGKKDDREEVFVWNLNLARKGHTDAARDAQRLRSLMDEKEWKSLVKKLERWGIDSKQLDNLLQPAAAQQPASH
jgi:TPR repeat protein